MSVAKIQSSPPPPPPPLQSQSNQKSGSDNNNASSSSTPSCYEQLCIDESIVQKEIDNFLDIITPIDKNADNNATDDDDEEAVVIYSHLNPILQIGPVCGIVALAMAGQNNNNEITTTGINSDTILHEAIKLGCTKKGEMFSALAMVQLANKVFPTHEAILMNNQGLNSNDVMKKILSAISDGNTILVPYDADFNHSPSLRRGHGAHWAILHGILITNITPNTQTNKEKVKLEEKQQKNLSELHSSLKEFLQGKINRTIIKDDNKNNNDGQQQQLEQEKNNNKKTITIRPENITIELKNKLVNLFELEHTVCKCFAICHQGKSKHTGIWDLLDLIKSNENLIQVSPKITENQDIESMILFDMAEFLSHKMVILQNKKNQP